MRTDLTLHISRSLYSTLLSSSSIYAVHFNLESSASLGCMGGYSQNVMLGPNSPIYAPLHPTSPLLPPSRTRLSSLQHYFQYIDHGFGLIGDIILRCSLEKLRSAKRSKRASPKRDSSPRNSSNSKSTGSMIALESK
jgi:hypothetical protein